MRDLPDESLRSATDWRVVIDFPFDDAGHSPADDLARLQRFQAANKDAQTLVWLPAFFSPTTQKELGTYAALDHILTGERYEDYASHLSAVDRASARTLLENQRSQLRQRLIACLEGAYGIAQPLPGSVDGSHFEGPGDQFVSLDPTFKPQPPVGANLGQAFAHLLDQMLSHRFPAHPTFEIDVKPAILRKVLEQLEEAAQTEDGRALVDKPLRAQLRQVANPLDLGTMHETHFVLGHHWRNHFSRKMAEGGIVNPTVGHLRSWIDQPSPMGLPREIQNLVILAFADQTNRSFFRHGGPIEPALDGLPDELELREQTLPAQDLWEKAAERAAAIFGFVASPLRNAANVSRLTDEVTRLAQEMRDPAARLATALRDRVKAVGLGEDGDRLRTAKAGRQLVEALVAAQSEGPVAVLAQAQAPTSDQSLGKSLKSASQVVGTLESTNWEVFEAVATLTDDRSKAAAAIRKRVAEALGHDELATALGPALSGAQSDALKLLVKVEPAPPPALPSTPPPLPYPGQVTVDRGTHDALTPADAEAVLTKLQAILKRDASLRLRLVWELFKPGK